VETVSTNPSPHIIILDKINLHLEHKTITILTGPSGSGKTTLCKAIVNLLPPGLAITHGHIFLEDCELNVKTFSSFRGRKIFYIPQGGPNVLNPVVKIKHQLKELELVKGVSPGDNQDRPLKITLDQMAFSLQQLGVSVIDSYRLLNAYPFQLSGGENQSCILAMAILLKPSLLMIDEPFAGIDEYVYRDCVLKLRDIQRLYNITILLVSHQLSFVSEMTDRVITMADISAKRESQK